MVKSFTFSAILAATATLFLTSTSILTEAVPVRREIQFGQTAAVISDTAYCLFLPPMPGGNIAESESDAVAFCNTQIPIAIGARLLPAGLVQTVHFVENTEEEWVQITGRMDISAYNLSPDDHGGQYDMRAPIGSTCAGYNAFVQITEPNLGTYCMRCCRNSDSCPTGRSELGCAGLLGGNYS
ncbi:hypothetical protein EDD21DRAFT_391515 [Dissophora ornata]|nr:hypothetical protein BGZ58_007139 [Dissophora ornata]KAI8595324.1 hypothetical protein EDD21DRAFT_391515 [Dissophora ornata]